MPGEAIAITLALLRKPIEDIYSGAKGQVAKSLRPLTTASALKKIHKSLSALQKVKTMWHVAKEQKLSYFYYPSKVVIDDKPKTIENISEIDGSHNLVIQGTVGQGKSTFLRYLCLQELRSQSRIPVLVELRRYERKTVFKEFLGEQIRAYGIPCDADILEYLLESGKVVLLLDGFDEIEPDSVTSIVNDLELLALRFDELQIVVTSRPLSGIERSAQFRVYPLAPLTPDDHLPFLNRTVHDHDERDRIARAIKTSGNEIKTLLDTPLLLTLLVVVYSAAQRIPPSLSEFYELLFQTLLSRHDATKTGFKRKRATGLSDSDLRKTFDAFCYASSQSNLLVLSHQEIRTILKRAHKVTKIDVDVDAFIKDVTQVACLMQQEALKYHFVHKSVVEFHAASFIRESPEENAIKFYSKVATQDLQWYQELQFLSQIDRHRYLRYFCIPTIEHSLQLFDVPANTDPELFEADHEMVARLSKAIELQNRKGDAPSIDYSGLSTMDVARVFARINVIIMKDLKSLNDFIGTTDWDGTTLHALERLGCVDAVRKAIEIEVKQKLRRYRASTAELERDTDVDDFINPIT